MILYSKGKHVFYEGEQVKLWGKNESDVSQIIQKRERELKKTNCSVKKKKEEKRFQERKRLWTVGPRALIFTHQKERGGRRREETWQDTSIKAGQRKPGLEAISKPSTRGTSRENKSWSGNKDTDVRVWVTVCSQKMHTQVCACLIILSLWFVSCLQLCIHCLHIWLYLCAKLWSADRANTTLLSFLLNLQMSLWQHYWSKPQKARLPTQMVKSGNAGKQNSFKAQLAVCQNANKAETKRSHQQYVQLDRRESKGKLGKKENLRYTEATNEIIFYLTFIFFLD